jgi:glycerol-3-phosphate acyltransferase PlsX
MTARIVVDAMGGDYAPQEVVAGAMMALGGLGVELVLVGSLEAIRQELRGTAEMPGLRVIEAGDVIEMDDHALDAARAKPDSSIHVGLRMLKAGEADAFVTAGNTGATMAASLLTLGRVKGISRPGLAAIFPTAAPTPSIFIDIGANADCKAIHLLQYAHMGVTYAERMLGIARPRLGLLSIGEEDTKGNQLVLEVNQALRASSLNFAGNVEGKDVLRGVCDVVVMDGFAGNVLVKTAEGVAELMFGELRKAVELTPWNRAAGFVLMSELRKVRQRLDYSTYGGAVLLGVEGVVTIAHGRSNARAVFSAIRVARDAVQNGVLESIRETGREVPARRGDRGDAEEEQP